MNLVLYIHLKQINFPFRKVPVIVLKREYTHELEWYLERL